MFSQIQIFSAALLLVFLLGTGIEAAPILKRVEFHSGGLFSRKELLRWSTLEPGKALAEESLNAAMTSLLTELAQQGYYFAAVDSLRQNLSPDSVETEIAVFLNEGPRLILSSVAFEDAEDSLGQAKASGNFPLGGKIDQNRLDESLEKCLLQGEEQGYAFYNLELKDYRIIEEHSGYKLNLTFSRHPGPLAALQTVDVKGNKVTRADYIVRETRLRKGALFSPQKLEKARTYLQQTRLFQQVKPMEIILYRDGFHAAVEVEEKRFNSLDGAVGYVPGSGGSKGYWTGLVDISFNNVLGSGRQFAIYWQQPNRNSQDISLRYKEPWIAGLPLDASFSFSQSVRAVSGILEASSDTRYLNRSADLKLTYALTENIFLTGGVEQAETIPDSLSRYAAGIPHSLSRGFLAGIALDSRDEPLNPQSGYFYSTTASVADKENYVPPDADIPSSVEENRITIALEVAQAVASSLVIFNRMYLTSVDSPQEKLPVSEMYFFGGANSVRGYREEQFFGSTVAYSNVELRWLIGRYSRIFLFNDWGYNERRILNVSGDATLNNWWHYSYGAGISFETEIGLFGINYGVAQNISPANGMFHFRLRNEF